jgi:hypothetical protein
MQVITVQEFCATNKVSALSSVRVNENGYPFLTLLSPEFEGGAQNIYFSKSVAMQVKVGTTPKELGLKDYVIATTTNAAGETRLKLSKTQYVSVEDLF